MIEEIYIENFAIIEKTSIKFTPKLNVLTGETGAGKSIIIEALELILGSRADKDLIGIYGDKSIVEASLKVSNDIVKYLSKEFSIETDKNIIITREIYRDENSVARLNNRRVTLNVIKALMAKIVNIHGQNENIALNNKKNYIDILDTMEEKTKDPLIKLESLFNQKKKISKKIESLDMDDGEVERQIDVLTYQIQEIEDAQLEKKDIDQITAEYKKLSNASEIQKSLNKVKELFTSSDYNQVDIMTSIAKVVSEMEKIASFDDNLDKIYQSIKSISYQLDDINSDLYDSIDSLSIDEERIQVIDDYFHLLEDLKRKYGQNKDDILAFKNRAEVKLEELKNRSEILRSYLKEIESIDKEIEVTSQKLSSLRKERAGKLERELLIELKNLNFPHANFIIDIEDKKEVDSKGKDKVDFLVSFNMGQKPASLSKIASGGEVSRFMLALKIVMADLDDISVLVFDEIDTGISGITATKVGKTLKDLSDKYQVILVSHLAQIAIYADHHILINKYTEDGLTKTRLKEIEGEERIYEIARLIAGDRITERALQTAQEQLESIR